ncbi:MULTISPECIES: DNA translocase FtsK [unclassified Ensifer]|uniref:DNA translocase FtsK n=1 Tax=unclassified Ensifer TaxID=2633371 RepID=UPI000813A90D|nr:MULTISPECIES: DNA translocase FtsK [unclassified Ensifer]OCP19119.1 cell division protein FtsK [Ensifer sp. LC54]OCP27275.1 cell division protein FtsK [Ensifer sp. LC384]
MRIPRTNFSQAALHDANQADYHDDPQDGALSDMPPHDADPVDPYQLYEAPAAPRRPANQQSDATAHVGRAARLYGQGTAYAPAQVTTSTDEPLPTLSEIAGHYGDATWESHFFLAPNVRFTRTPEREFTKRRAPSGSESDVAPEEDIAPGENAVVETAPADVAPVAIEIAVPAASPVVVDVAPEFEPEPALPSYSPSELLRVLTSQLPHWSSAPKADAANAASGATVADAAVAPSLAEQSANEAPAASATPAAPVEPAPIVEPMPAMAETQADTRLSFLSDFAFFEFGPSALDDGSLEAATVQPKPFVETAVPASFTPAPVVSMSPPAAVKAVEIRRMPPTAITSLFRVVECRPAAVAPATPAAAVAALEEPVSVEPAREAPAPVVVPSEIASVPPAAVEPAEITPLMAVEEPVRTVATVSKAAITMPAQVSRAPSLLPPIGATERFAHADGYEFPAEDLLQEPPEGRGFFMSQEQLEQNAGLLESVLEDFGVRGEIIHVRPGPVVTLYEFEPAPGVKSSRVINLADDIARSMSALSARVAVVPGRNVIGIELPNATRETVYFRELIESVDFRKTNCKLALCLGKTIGGEPVIAELAKMPHLLVAGTTGSGKSVAINTMILSLLYRLKPEECRMIMVDPKMLELSVYDGIPHLLTPVVTDPKKAVMALKWAVREMEDRYRKMSRLGVRNIDGYNQRAAAAREMGEPVMCTVQTGFEKGTGEALFEQQEMDLAPMPYIVVIVDEMADLMMVAGKEIEGAIQRLAQMARAAGIHLIMATQRPSVDVITGTIKANFPTRISFQVTSKIDSRTILGEQGAEQLLGQGDMLHMQGGGRIARVHGPFVSDQEVEHVVAHLKTQGRPEYLETVTADEEEEEPAEEQGAVFDKTGMASEDGNELYDQAVKVVLRDKKCSTSYIQRRLGIGYNRAASLVERMEKEGLVGAANHVGKREIIHGNRDHTIAPDSDDMD